MQKKTVRLVLISLLSAIAFVLMMLEFPIFAAIPGLQHLKLDFGDVPAAFAGALLSPGVGVVVELIKNLLELLVRGIGSQMGFGNLMNLLVGCAYVVPFALLYKRFLGRFRSRAACLTLAGVIASLIMIVIGAAGNYLDRTVVLPLFPAYRANGSRVAHSGGRSHGAQCGKGCIGHRSDVSTTGRFGKIPDTLYPASGKAGKTGKVREVQMIGFIGRYGMKWGRRCCIASGNQS